MDKRTANVKRVLKGYGDLQLNKLDRHPDIIAKNAEDMKFLTALISEELETRSSKKDREKDYSKEWER